MSPSFAQLKERLWGTYDKCAKNVFLGLLVLRCILLDTWGGWNRLTGLLRRERFCSRILRS